MWAPTIKSDELYHYGVLGMRWGVRRYQNYDGTRKAAGKKHEAEKRKGLTDEQKSFLKKAAIATLVIGGVAATAIVISKHPELLDMAKRGELVVDKFKNKTIKDFKEGDILGVDDNFVLTSKNAAECAKNINPSYSKTNCGSCASATLMNAMGGNYQALDSVPDHMRITLDDGTKGEGYDPKKLIDCFEGGKWSKRITNYDNSRRKAANDLEKQLLSQGEGAKGLFYIEQGLPVKVTDKITGEIKEKHKPGHYYMWSIIDGKVHVLEGQPPSAQSTGADYCTSLFDEIVRPGCDLADGDKGIIWARLDNCKVKPGRESDLFKPRN